MEIKDRVYGEEEIKEQVLIDLIQSKAVQRLKKISQMGIPREYYHRAVYSRYEHSLGVLVLLRKLNASLEEQVAGLLHDVSHTAFSHVIDWVLGDPTKEDYQDNNHEKIIFNSDIPQILEKYNFNSKEIVNHKNFSLLEKDAPSLCVDRIDYTLRELVIGGKKGLVNKIVSNLTNNQGEVVFTSLGDAENFAKEYMNLQNEHWAGNQAKVRYFILADILKKGLEKKIITKNDLMKTDKEVLEMLCKSNCENIINNLYLLKTPLEIIEDEEGIELKKKFRYVDPEILVDNETLYLTQLSGDYKFLLEKQKQNSNNSKKVKITGYN